MNFATVSHKLSVYAGMQASSKEQCEMCLVILHRCIMSL